VSSSAIPVENTRALIAVATTNYSSLTGGIVDNTNQVGTTQCPPIIPPTDDTTTKVDPCKLKKHLDSLAANAAVANANTMIYNEIGSQHEYATDINLKTFPPNGSYIITPLITDFNLTSVSSNFTWNSTNGYTIDISHDHPQGDGPSPIDVFRLYVNSNNAQLDNAGPSALSYYENNAAITTITASTTYVITGTDYVKLATLYQQYKANPTAFNNNFSDLTAQYSGQWDVALLLIFGNSINLYESSYNKPPYNLYQIVNGKRTQINCP
jgi:hypothetical protein